jgi:hypothetical protein
MGRRPSLRNPSQQMHMADRTVMHGLRRGQSAPESPRLMAGGRVLHNLSITQCDAARKLAGIGRWRTVPASPEQQVHAPAACAWARRPGRRQGTRHPAWRARLPGRGLLPAPTGTRGVSSQIMPAAVQGRSSGPMQPAAGISALSTETTEVPAAREPAQITRIIAGQWRWRWDLNPRKTCAFTRFRGLCITVRRRPRASLAA